MARRARGLTDLQLRTLLLVLAAFDLVLGGGTLLWPDIYHSLMQPWLNSYEPLLLRTAALWLFFGVVELLAGLRLRHDLLIAVGALRLMEVPADIVYRFVAMGLGPFGKTALVAAPIINLALGLMLIGEARKR